MHFKQVKSKGILNNMICKKATVMLSGGFQISGSFLVVMLARKGYVIQRDTPVRQKSKLPGHYFGFPAPLPSAVLFNA